jgi:hypothetical protein
MRLLLITYRLHRNMVLAFSSAMIWALISTGQYWPQSAAPSARCISGLPCSIMLKKV